jgi:S1-C subfamily serine protease
VASPFDGYEVEARMRPSAQAYRFDLDQTLSAVVALQARIPEDAFTAETLGTARLGNGAVIGPNGLVLTIGYLIMEAEEVVLTRNDGERIPAHVLGTDPVTGFGMVQALQPLDLPTLPLGNSHNLEAESSVILAGAGGRAHAAAGHVLARMPFAGYWEYLLENAIITEPAHPHWSGAALIGGTGELLGVGSLSLQRQTRSGAISPINMFVPSELGPHVVIAGTNPHGPAARAELRAGDVVIAVGGVAVSDLADFYTQLWAQGPAGATIPLRIQRDYDVFDVEVRSVDRTALLKKPKFN